MATAAPAKPSLVPAFLALLVVIFFGYLLYSDLTPSRTEHTIIPPIDIIDPPLTVIVNDSKAPDGEKIIEQEAELFVENLSPKTNTPVVVGENNNQFVRSNSIISVPDLEQRMTSLQELMNDQNLTADTPIILHFTSEDRSQTTLAELSKNIEDHTETITIITIDGETITAPLTELLSREDLDRNSLITLLLKNQHSVKTRFADLADIEISPSQSLIATIHHSVQELSISEMLPQNTPMDDSLFYIHRVTEQDVQGLWGIIQAGLIDEFRQGLRLEGISRNKDLIQAVIPSDADEQLPSGLSSFLGKILANKVDSSYSYNLKTRSIDFDIDLIHPGQQLIIIKFAPGELKQIYQFFSEKRNQGTETFAISD